MLTSPSLRGSLIEFKRHLRTEVVRGDGAYVMSERGTTIVQGPHVETVMPLLDGTRDISAVLRAAGAGVTPAELGELLGSLSKAGLISYREPGRDTGERGRSIEAFWEAAGLDGPLSAARTEVARIRVLAIGRIGEAAVRSELEAAGLGCLPAGARACEAQLTVVVCDDYLSPALREIDAEQRAAGTPWLLAKPSGTITWTGPVFQPEQGACWACLAHWLRGHRSAELAVQHALQMAEPPHSPEVSLFATLRIGLQLAALEAAKWLTGYRHPGQNAVLTVDTLDLQSRSHELRRRPQCPACGTPAVGSERVTSPMVLQSRPKAAHEGNGHRALAPQQVLERYSHLVSPVTGPIKEIRRSSRGPAFLNSFVAGHNIAVPEAGLAGLRHYSGGKGASELDGRVSALCEALERHSGMYQGNEPRVRDTRRGLGEAAIHPNQCQLYDERQYRDRARWNPRNSTFHYVCDTLDDETPIDWTPIWSMTTGRHRLLPTSLLYYNAPATENGRQPALADSNGCAAGSSLEDAILQGFLELVERDAVALWWYNRTRQAGIDLTAFRSPWITELIEVHRELNREIWALDLTSDLGIPVVVALSRRTDRPQEDIVLGFGANFDLSIALRRALTEMNQLLPYALDSTADNADRALQDPQVLDWWNRATIANQPYLLPDPVLPPTRPGCHPHVTHNDLRDDVNTASTLMQRHGMELLVLDQTRPDIGLPVVRVVVPGLRHFWARFGPGRLFDVPVRLGRLTEPTRYRDLNPIPLFL